MNHSIIRLLCVGSLIGLGAAPLTIAQIRTNAIGTLEASIDGEAYSAEMLEAPSEGSATADFLLMGSMVNVTIQAHDPEAESRMKNVLSMDINLVGTDATASVTDSTVSYWPDSMSGPFYTSDEGGGDTEVMLDTLSLDNSKGQISGSFTTTVCAKESYFAEIDMTDCLPVEGTFETDLQRIG